MAYRGHSKPQADFLADVGRFLYGDREQGFLGPLAAALHVKPLMLTHWLNGKSKLNSDHPVLKEALGLVHTRLQQQADGWQARWDELEEAARPDTPLSVVGHPTGERFASPPIDGNRKMPASVVTTITPERRAAVRRHK